MTKQKRLRKPRPVKTDSGMLLAEIESSGIVFVEGVRDNYSDLRVVKKIHKFLGRAIAYLEEKEKLETANG